MGGVAEGFDPAPPGAGGKLGHLRPLAFVEPQVVERGRLDEQVELPRGAEHRQVGEDRLDPPRGVPQLGLRGRVAPSLLDELLVVSERRREQPLAKPLHPRPVGKLLLADPDQLVDRPAGEAEPRLGLFRSLTLPAVRRFRLPLLGQRLRLLAADEGRADQRRGRQKDQRDDAGPDDRRVPPRPGPQPLGGRRPAGQDRPAVEEPLQVVGQLLRRPVAVGRLLAERLQDDRLQCAGDGPVQCAGAGGSSSAICWISALRSRPSKGGRRVSSS